MKKTGTLLLAIFLVTSGLVVLAEPAEAQTSLLWDRDYGLQGSGNCVISTQDGGYAIAGVSQRQFIIIKTDSVGELQWQKIHGEGTANSIVQTSDSGYAIAGTGTDFNFVKTDATGNIQWKKNYNNSGVSFLIKSVIQTADGGYAMAGWTPATSSPNLDWTIKTDAAGNIVWKKTLGVTPAQSMATCIVQEEDGFVLAANGNLYKLNQNGDAQWSTPAAVANALIKTSDGGYLVAAGNGAGLIKKNHTGGTEWSESYRYQDAKWSFFHSVTQTRDGGYAICGVAYPAYNGLAWILKVDSNGTFVGEIAISPETGINNRAFSIVTAEDGSIVFSGSKNAPNGEGDIWLAKVSPEAIPELPSWVILPLFVIVTSMTTLVFWKKRKQGKTLS